MYIYYYTTAYMYIYYYNNGCEEGQFGVFGSSYIRLNIPAWVPSQPVTLFFF